MKGADVLFFSVPTAVSYSYFRREYREGVPPGSCFFSCGVFVIHSALKTTNNSGKGQDRKSTTQI